MNFIDLKKQQQLIRKNLNISLNKVLDHGQYIMGPEVFELEEKLAQYVGVKNCISVSSGTDALLVSMLALGIKPGDEVITSSFTYIAAIEMIVLIGAKPIYVDIDQETFNINPGKIESAITNKTKLIIPVSLFGQCADMDKINSIAKKYELPVLEDGAQSFGAMHNGKKSCSLSLIGCTSFFPSKPLGCYGDGGAIFTDDDNLAIQMRELRSHGQRKRYHHHSVGINGRLDTIQAAILLTKFEIFSHEVTLRNKIGNRYNELFGNHTSIKVPEALEGNLHIFAQYSIVSENRDNIGKQLSKIGVPSTIYYPIPAHKQPIFKTDKFYLPISEYISNRVISLPMHPYLNNEDQQLIVNKCIEVANAV
jgi:UDP-2-acetamido-2-deoxy-ribo-hexuluronate aminotransferase